MIFADKLLLDSLLQNNLLTINKKSHERTWEYYYKQYRKAFRVFLEIAKQKRYQTNRKFMPFMFIMRHSIELFLKEKISKTMTTWEQYGTTHNLEKLYQIANINDQEFLKHLDCLNCNSEGDCWRYVSDRNESSYFKERKEIHAFDACNYYCLFLDNDTSLTNVSTDRILQWELTFHTTDDHTLGIIGTQYDFAIKDILLAIQDRKISINEIYLPLLFLLRHSLELKLKASIIELGNVVEEKDRSKVNQIHNVKKLYDVLAKHTDNAIESITNHQFKKQSENLRNVTEEYKEIIKLLDANSHLFRFPKDKKGKDANFIPKSDCVSTILKLYKESDPFLCFGVPVLFEADVLKIGDDKERKYYE
ncbi:hypothetical protein [Alloprevotella tannerae]|uniref:hypothetical protein n=1 Tax=Alloprevotella tannerae TaxID=76122 RepID=UPI0028F0C53D|nr:hypothetical protein [Alloprevotella tannerae]